MRASSPASRPRLGVGWCAPTRCRERRRCTHFGAVVLLKGADTLVASPDGTAVVSDFGPPSLATAGTGDVLTGVVAAFLAKGVDAATAAAAAAVAHARGAARKAPDSLPATCSPGFLVLSPASTRTGPPVAQP